MIITLKDGSTKEYAEAKSVIEIASDISEGLARVACAGEVLSLIHIWYLAKCPSRHLLQIMRTKENSIR